MDTYSVVCGVDVYAPIRLSLIRGSEAHGAKNFADILADFRREHETRMAQFSVELPAQISFGPNYAEFVYLRGDTQLGTIRLNETGLRYIDGFCPVLNPFEFSLDLAVAILLGKGIAPPDDLPRSSQLSDRLMNQLPEALIRLLVAACICPQQLYGSETAFGRPPIDQVDFDPTVQMWGVGAKATSYPRGFEKIALDAHRLLFGADVRLERYSPEYVRQSVWAYDNGLDYRSVLREGRLQAQY